MKLRRIAIILVLLTLQAAAVYWYCKSAIVVGNAVKTAENGGRITSLEFQKQRQKDGGLPGHRKRIDDFIEIVSGMDFERCSVALHAVATSRDGFNSVEVADLSPMGEPGGLDGTVNKILADRRCAKMYAILQEMDAESARARSLTLFDTKLKQHVDFWRREMTFCESRDNPIDAESGSFVSQGEVDMKNIDFTGKDYGPGAKFECATLNQHALTVSLFLVGCFCPPIEFLDKADQWHETVAPIVEQINGDVKYRLLTMEALFNGIPNPLLVCNLMLMVASRADGGGEAQAEKVLKWPELAYELRRGTARVVSFYAWDAETMASDFTHVHAFVPSSEDAVMTRFAAVRSWNFHLKLDASRKQEFYLELKTRFILELGL